MAALERNRRSIASVHPDPSAEHLVRLNYEPAGSEPPEAAPDRLRAARAALGELPAREAPSPVEKPRAAEWPKPVITGTGEAAPQAYREHGGGADRGMRPREAERIGAELLRVPGASHWPHSQRADVVNAALREFRASAG